VILLLTQCFPPDHGGIEAAMGHIARALHAAGEELVVLADHIRGGQPEPGWPFPVHRFGGPRLWRRFRKARALARLAPDAVLADSWKSLEALPARTPRVVVLAHGNELLRRDGRRGARIARALARADLVVANSSYTAGLLAGLHRHVEVIHPPIDPPVAPPRAARPGLILSLGRLEARKGLDMVIRALPALPGARHLIIGEGPDEGRLRALAAECGVTDRVEFAGRVDDAEKFRLIAQAEIMAMPVRREGNSVEGFGMVYLEAAWCGVPALAGREGGAADAVVDEQTGLLVDGADPLAVQSALARLLGDAALRERLGHAAQARAGDFTWRATLPRYLSALGRSPAGNAWNSAG